MCAASRSASAGSTPESRMLWVNASTSSVARTTGMPPISARRCFAIADSPPAISSRTTCEVKSRCCSRFKSHQSQVNCWRAACRGREPGAQPHSSVSCFRCRCAWPLRGSSLAAKFNQNTGQNQARKCCSSFRKDFRALFNKLAGLRFHALLPCLFFGDALLCRIFPYVRFAPPRLNPSCRKSMAAKGIRYWAVQSEEVND